MVIKITAGPIMVATSLLVTLSVFLQSRIGIGQDDHNIHRKVYIESESSFDDEVTPNPVLLLDLITEETTIEDILLSQSIVPTNVHRNDIKDVLRFQKWIYHNQNPQDCSQAQQQHFRGWSSGLGSHLQIIGNSFLRALLNRHVFILDYHKIDYVDPSRCSDQNYKCLFLPTTKCNAREFDLPTGAKNMEQGPHRCTTFDPITFTEEAQLSQVYSTDWYFREALRYLTRPNIELRQFIEEVKNEIGLSNVGKKGIGLKIRAGEDKEQEVHNIANLKCLNINAGKGMDWVNEIKRHCERVHCEYVFLSADKDTELLEEELQNLPFDIKVMDSKYFVQQDLSHGTSAASMIKDNIQKRHEGSDESADFDEAMSLMAMMQIMAETGTIVGSFTSSLTRRIYDLLGMIEDNPASLFTEIDGLSYFNCWRDLGEWGLHKKDKDGNLVYDCFSSPQPLQRQVATNYSLKYPEQCQVPIPPTNMKCGSVGYWYCSKSNVAYLPNPKVCSSTVRSILKRKFDGTCAEMPPGTLHMIPKDAYVFTVARNPISRVFAAYREFDSHLLMHPYPEGLKSNFIHMDRNNEPQRFRTFLDDLFTGRTGLNDGYTGWPAHGYPQYLVMCGAPHVNFTLRQESFNEGWQDMMEDMGPVHNSLLKSADLNAKNVGSNLHDRKVFEDSLGFDVMKTMPAFETAHTRLPTVMTDSDYELICKYFKEDFSCLGYSCDYNSTALAEKAYDKLNKMEQARWLPDSNKLPSQLILEQKLERAEYRVVVAQKRQEAAEKRMEHAQKAQERAEQRITKLTKTEAHNLKKQNLIKKQAKKQAIDGE